GQIKFGGAIAVDIDTARFPMIEDAILIGVEVARADHHLMESSRQTIGDIGARPEDHAVIAAPLKASIAEIVGWRVGDRVINTEALDRMAANLRVDLNDWHRPRWRKLWRSRLPATPSQLHCPDSRLVGK